MSHQAFVDFYTKYLDSAAGDIARKSFDGLTDQNAICAKMVELGSAAGFTFSADEVRAVMQASEAKAAEALAKASGELSEDQLEGVVGGAGLIASVPLVQIGTMSPSNLKLPGGAASFSTVMCPW